MEIRSRTVSTTVLIEQYLDELLNHGRSPSTANAYADRLRYFMSWLTATEIPLEAVTRDTAEQYISDMRAQGLSPKYQRARIGVVKAFFGWLSDEKELIPKNPLARLKSIKVPRRLPRILSEGEAEKVMEAALPGRESVACELLYGSGVRAMEVLGINLDDLDLDGAQVLIRGKGGDEDMQPISDHAVDAIRAWLPIRAEMLDSPRRLQAQASDLRAQGLSFREIAKRMGVSLPVAHKYVVAPIRLLDETPLLVGREGRISDSTLREIVTKVAERAGIDRRVYPHLLRHCYATHLLNGGANLREVQELLRHKNLSTTMIYTHISRKAAREAFRTAHPRAIRDPAAPSGEDTPECSRPNSSPSP